MRKKWPYKLIKQYNTKVRTYGNDIVFSIKTSRYGLFLDFAVVTPNQIVIRGSMRPLIVRKRVNQILQEFGQPYTLVKVHHTVKIVQHYPFRHYSRNRVVCWYDGEEYSFDIETQP